MILIWEAHEEDLLALPFQGGKELFGLLDGTAQIVFSVQDEQRRGDVRRIGEWRVLSVPLHIVPWQRAALGLKEGDPDVAGAEEGSDIIDGAF